MKYYSTRNSAERVTASQAIIRGLAPDGGLYVPESFPKVGEEFIRGLCALDYRARAAEIMALFLEEFTVEELTAFARRAYSDNYDCPEAAPVRFIDDATAFLELWHGPTCAFKDMALQMLPLLLTASLRKNGEERGACILVATSGDTGKAALEGFAGVEGTSIFVFYPRDGVSDIQRLQMVTQRGANVGVCSVLGNFDDAQSGVKRIFGDRAFAEAIAKRGYFLSSANSINWGRLLPQIVYYFSAYCDCVNSRRIDPGDEVVFCVPTGNFGNILAGWYAKQMGLPVGRFVCASNENNVLTDFIGTGVYDRNRPFHTTISPSMDILISSNLERLLYSLSGDAAVRGYMSSLAESGRYSVTPECLARIRADFHGGMCTDEDTKNTIREVWDGRGCLIDTHTAVAYKVLRDYRDATGDRRAAVVVSTASPYKFAADVLDALGEKAGDDVLSSLHRATGTSIPAPLAGLAGREVRFTQQAGKEDMLSAVDGFLKRNT